MTKVYPKVEIPSLLSSDQQRFSGETSTAGRNHDPVVLTVWKKSLLFNCDGFTVFDSKGNLVFRVDNYAAGNKSEIVLMDASGRSLVTIRRKRASLTDTWLVYDGETTVKPRFTVTNAQFHQHEVDSSCEYHRITKQQKSMAYEIEGSYAQRCCLVYDDKRTRVAEIKRKEAVGGVAFGGDVFRLVVQPEIDSTVAMALVLLLDQMFGGSSRRF